MSFLNGKKRIKMRKLTEADAQDAAMLYAFSSKNDEYFIELFGVNNVVQSVLEKFSCDVYNAIVHGCSIGAFYKDQLVGIILSFNITDWRNNHRREYEHVFQTDDDFVNTVKEFLKSQKTDILYVFAVCVSEDWRCKGIATNLITELCNKYVKRFSIVSDAYTYVALPMWLSNEFLETQINDVNFVYRL